MEGISDHLKHCSQEDSVGSEPSIPANNSNRESLSKEVGKSIEKLIVNDIKPLDIISKKSLENAISLVIALGGSTNAVLHFLAIARSANIEFSLDDFQKISDKTPYIANLKPSGKYLMEDLHEDDVLLNKD